MNVNHFYATLELCSGIGTPLAADVLWGHIAWGIRYHQGNSFLEDWLKLYDLDTPPLILSDPLPHHTFPMPALPQGPRPVSTPSREEMKAFKKRKKVDSISLAHWEKLSQDVSGNSLAEIIGKQQPQHPTQVTITHAGVNRLTGGTANIEGGSLYSSKQAVYSRGAKFDLWGCSPESIDTVKNWIEWGIEGGYGRDAATGAGHLKLVTCQQRELPGCQKANACMLLGPAIPSPGDPHRGFFRTIMKSGRVGGDFAIGELPGGSTQRQKYPVTMLSAGTILVTDNPPRYLGQVPGGIHEYSGIRQYAIAPAVPLKLSEETLTHPLLQHSQTESEVSA